MRYMLCRPTVFQGCSSFLILLRLSARPGAFLRFRSIMAWKISLLIFIIKITAWFHNLHHVKKRILGKHGSPPVQISLPPHCVEVLFLAGTMFPFCLQNHLRWRFPYAMVTVQLSSCCADVSVNSFSVTSVFSRLLDRGSSFRSFSCRSSCLPVFSSASAISLEVMDPNSLAGIRALGIRSLRLFFPVSQPFP